MRISPKKEIRLWLTLCFCVYVLLGIQGLDMTDEGWVLTGYQQFFKAPESISYLFLYYNALLVGGVWEVLFGDFGIIAFRVLAALCVTATAAVAYRLLRRRMSVTVFALGLIAVFFCNNYGIIVFNHNYLSALLTTLSVWLMVTGLDRSDGRRLFMAGLVIGANCLTRLPNVALTALLSLLMLHFIYERSARLSFRLFIHAVAGVLAGGAVIVGIMAVLGHIGLFVDNLGAGMSAASASDSTHRLSYLAGVYAGNLLDMAAQLPLILFPPALWKTGVTVILTYTVATLCIARYIFVHRSDKMAVYTASAALLVMFTQPLGSDFGIANLGVYSLWIALPLTCQTVAEELCRAGQRQWLLWLKRAWVVLIVAPFLFFNSRSLLFNAYNDPGSRWRKTAGIHNPLATILTSDDYQQAADSLLVNMAKYVPENERILCFQHVPMVHYLTKTRPYLPNPWVWTYDSELFERLLTKTAEEQGPPPFILVDKTRQCYWTTPDPDWDNDLAEETYEHKNGRIRAMRRFITLHPYRRLWADRHFVLYALRP